MRSLAGMTVSLWGRLRIHPFALLVAAAIISFALAYAIDSGAK